MQYTEIIKLLDAGYTKEEIMQMKEPEKAADQEPEKKDPEKKEPAKAADPEPVKDPVNETLGELKELFADMKKEFTAMNIMNSRREDEAKTGEDIIASIINPPKKNKKEGK